MPKKSGQRRKKMAAGNAATPVAAGYGIARPTLSPQIRMQSGRCVVSHREYVCDVHAAGMNFNVATTPLQPGYSGSFPWLSTVAMAYEKYKFLSLVAEYVPMCGTTTQGSVMIAIDYDSSDDDPANKAEMLTFAGALEVAPWMAAKVALSPTGERRDPYLTVRTFFRDDSSVNFNTGLLMIATQGMQPESTTTVGSIWLSYTIELTIPQRERDGAFLGTNTTPTCSPSEPLGTDFVQSNSGIANTVPWTITSEMITGVGKRLVLRFLQDWAGGLIFSTYTPGQATPSIDMIPDVAHSSYGIFTGTHVSSRTNNGLNVSALTCAGKAGERILMEASQIIGVLPAILTVNAYEGVMPFWPYSIGAPDPGPVPVPPSSEQKSFGPSGDASVGRADAAAGTLPAPGPGGRGTVYHR